MFGKPCDPQTFYATTGTGLWICLMLPFRNQHRLDIAPVDAHHSPTGRYIECDGLLFGYPVNPRKYWELEKHEQGTVEYPEN